MIGVVTRGLAATAVAVGVCIFAPAPASADVERTANYPGPAYATENPVGRGLRVSTPTYTKAQSKTWWHDGSWWALLYDTTDADVRVAELTSTHEWRMTLAVVAHDPLAVGDVVVDGDRIHAVVRDRAGLVVKSLRYKQRSRFYQVDPVHTMRLPARGSSAATMAQDSTGRLWISFVRASRLLVMHSDREQLHWSPTYTPDVQGTTLGQQEISEVVAANDAITVIWSDQRGGAFYAAVHRDGTADGAWTASAIASGPKIADDHINAHVVPSPKGDTLLVVVKTSRNDLFEPVPDDPLIMLLVRDPAGRWSQHVVSTVADEWTRPIVTADAAGLVYVFARRAGSIVFKESSLAQLTFKVGEGRHLMTGTGASFTDPTVGTQTPDSVTGVLVLVSDETHRRYWHAELAVDGSARAASRADAPDVVPPAAPTQVRGEAQGRTVHLTWNPSVEQVAWKPADHAPPVRYLVLQDGRQVGQTSANAYSLHHGSGRHRYEVVAVDIAGNSSPSAVAALVRLDPEVPTSGNTVLVLIGAGAALLALGFGGYVHLRRHLHRSAQALVEASLPIFLPAPKGKHSRH